MLTVPKPEFTWCSAMLLEKLQQDLEEVEQDIKKAKGSQKTELINDAQSLRRKIEKAKKQL